MTWTKLSDDFADECWTLSDAAFRLQVEMLAYSNRKLLDCRIPKDEMRLFAKRPEAVAELVAKNYVRDTGDVYEVAFHSLYQPSRDQVLAYRESRSRNGRKGGRPRKNPDANHGAKHGANHRGRDGTGTGLSTGEEVQNATSTQESEWVEQNDGSWLNPVSGEQQDATSSLEQDLGRSGGLVLDWPVAPIGQGRRSS